MCWCYLNCADGVYDVQDLQQVMVSGPNLNETSIVSGGYGGSAEGIIPTGSIKGVWHVTLSRHPSFSLILDFVSFILVFNFYYYLFTYFCWNAFRPSYTFQ